MKRLLLLCALLLAGLTVRAADSARPNILFIIFDDWNGSTHAGAYGCDWIKTPNFDRIAKEGVLFSHAFTSNPKCSPCRASILTGRNTWQLKEAVSHNGMFPDGFETYPDLLEKAGYEPGLTGKGWGPGDFKTLAHRTRNPAGPSFDGLTNPVPATGISRIDYAGNFDAFLKKRDKAKPFCFWMGFHEPHRPYEYGSGLRLGKKLEDVKVPPFLPDTKIVRTDLLDYAVEVEWGDQQIGRALKALEEAGELDNTLVVVTSDHGMPFPYVKGQLHEDAFHLPLAIRWPKMIKPGRVVEDFINVRDFAPTYMELAGLKPHPQMTGRSFVDVLRSEKSGWIDEKRDVMLAGKERHDIGRFNDMGYPVRVLRTRDFLYVHNWQPERWPAGDPETDYGNVDPSPSKEVIKALGGYFYELSLGKRQPDELYRLSDDPSCVHNLANDLAFKDKMMELQYQMMSLLKEDEDPRALGHFEVFDLYKYQGGRGKGYDSWLKKQEETTLTDLEKKIEEEAKQPPKKRKRAAE
jgi:arylsulfatase A-like enzyme